MRRWCVPCWYTGFLHSNTQRWDQALLPPAGAQDSCIQILRGETKHCCPLLVHRIPSEVKPSTAAPCWYTGFPHSNTQEVRSNTAAPCWYTGFLHSNTQEVRSSTAAPCWYTGFLHSNTQRWDQTLHGAWLARVLVQVSWEVRSLRVDLFRVRIFNYLQGKTRTCSSSFSTGKFIDPWGSVWKERTNLWANADAVLDVQTKDENENENRSLPNMNRFIVCKTKTKIVKSNVKRMKEKRRVHSEKEGIQFVPQKP